MIKNVIIIFYDKLAINESLKIDKAKLIVLKE